MDFCKTVLVHFIIKFFNTDRFSNSLFSQAFLTARTHSKHCMSTPKHSTCTGTFLTVGIQQLLFDEYCQQLVHLTVVQLPTIFHINRSCDQCFVVHFTGLRLSNFNFLDAGDGNCTYQYNNQHFNTKFYDTKCVFKFIEVLTMYVPCFCFLLFVLLDGLVCFGWFMVFNATFNNISAISWQSVLLVGETGVSRENHRPVASL